MANSDTANEATLASVNSEAETAAVRIVSNLPRGQRGTPQGEQAEPSGAVNEELRDWSDDNEDLDMSELEENWEEELDHGAWDDMHDEADMDGIAWHAAALADELDPDDDVGLYDEDDEADSYNDDGLEDLEDTEDEEGSDDEWGAGGVDYYQGNSHYQRNLHGFRIAVHFVNPADVGVSFFQCYGHDATRDDQRSADDENPKQESFFSREGQQASQWFQLASSSNHFQSADSLCTGGTPSCSSMPGSQDEEIVMLQQRYCLALWRLPAASSPASSASASASPSGIPSSAAPSDAPSASPPTATPATPPAAPQPVPSAAPPAASPAAASAAASGGPDAEGASHLPSGQPESSCWVREEADAVLLAFTYPRYQAYSIARSPDGRFVAVGD
ncbi:hypothetical protein ABBQ38_000584 [Trebouxia sp. C0009 RCD-2024]